MITAIHLTSGSQKDIFPDLSNHDGGVVPFSLILVGPIRAQLEARARSSPGD